MQVEFSSFVESDLDVIADYIAHGNPTRAVSFLAEIRAKLRAVATHPLLYRLRPEIGEDARCARGSLCNFVPHRWRHREDRARRIWRDLLALFDPE
jgi:plasmid stabilization system protein ParE